jgi:hypothetical protein
VKRCIGIAAVSLLAAVASLGARSASAQSRGLYPLGMSATGSGIVADPGLSYSNLFLFYSRDKSVGPRRRSRRDGAELRAHGHEHDRVGQQEARVRQRQVLDDRDGADRE